MAPKHPTLLWALTLLLSAATGCAIVTLAVVAQPFASVMVQRCIPAGRLIVVALVCTGDVFQAWVYGPVPPEMPTVALPVAAPKHGTLV